MYLGSYKGSYIVGNSDEAYRFDSFGNIVGRASLGWVSSLQEVELISFLSTGKGLVEVYDGIRTFTIVRDISDLLFEIRLLPKDIRIGANFYIINDFWKIVIICIKPGIDLLKVYNRLGISHEYK